jgi:hypothetical protein
VPPTLLALWQTQSTFYDFMTLITQNKRDKSKPAVHVLVIGVSDYPYLEGGSKQKNFENAGLGQLTSPSASARALCERLQSSFSPPGLPLGSIEVLCSSRTQFQNEAGEAVDVATPTLARVRKAAGGWVARGNEHEDNLLLFYFCGHGVSSGIVHSLLLEDFGRNSNDPFNTGAIDAESFMDGISATNATKQVFIIDACRTVGHAAFARYGEQRGAPVISAAAHGRLGVVQQAALWATALGSQAYGLPNTPSVFMSAMLHAMEGGGALQDPNNGQWVIQPDMLKRAIDHIVQRVPAFASAGLQYATLDRMGQGIGVHQLAGVPSVPVKVNCNPTSRTSVTELHCSSGAQRGVGQTEPWYLDLVSDNYKFDAISAGTDEKSKMAYPNPPYTIVSFDFPA